MRNPFVAGNRGRFVAAILILGTALLGPSGCGATEDGVELPHPASSGVNANFLPGASTGCPRGDLLSLQKRSSNGSLVQVDVVLTDCDASLLLSGVAFEISYDDASLDFLGCTAGSLFPGGQLAPGTPTCTAGSGDLLGTIAIKLPNTVTVGGGSGGSADVVRLSFNVVRRGANSPVAFLGPDSLTGSSVFVLDAGTQQALVLALGAGGFAGGTFTSN